MPIIPVTATFITGVAACTHDAAHSRLLDVTGAPKYPAIDPVSGAWTLASTGYTIDAATYAELKTARALPSGTYAGCYVRASDGAVRQLKVSSGAVLPDVPPPPPPPGG